MKKLQSPVNKRLEEKLRRMASKRGNDSPHADELRRQTAAGAPAETPTGGTEKSENKEQ